MIDRPSADRIGERALEYDYQVREVASGELEIDALWELGEERVPLRGVCHAVLHGRSSPCEHCPLRTAPDTRATLRVIKGRSDAESGGHELISAIRTGTGTARVSVRRLAVATSTAILHARLDELAARAKLSDREWTVLRHLMQGAPIEEIASALDIGTRTVKFHQTNLLSKLGADSRVDLLRLFF